MRTKALVGLFSLVVLVMAAGAAQGGDKVTISDVPVTYDVPCGSQPFQISGTWHVVSRSVTDATGGTHTAVTVNLVGVRGTAPDGTMYIGVGSYSNSFTFSNGAESAMGYNTTQFIGTRGAPSFATHQFFIYKLTPSGQSLSIDRSEWECR